MQDLIIVDDDKPISVPSISPVCSFCSRLINPFTRQCEAFSSIPMQIWDGKVKHTQPYSGDGGVTFKKE